MGLGNPGACECPLVGEWAPSADMLEGGIQSGTLQRCCFHGRMSFSAPVSVSRVSPSCLLPLPGSLPRLARRSDPSLLSDFCLCAGTLHAPLKSGVSVPIALHLSHVQVPVAFKASHPGGLSSQCRTPGWEVQCGPQTPQSLRRTSPWIPLSSDCGLPVWACGS